MTDQQGWGPPQQPTWDHTQQFPAQQPPPPGYGYSPQQGYPPPPQQGFPGGPQQGFPGGPPGHRPRKRHRVRNVLLGVAGAIVLIIIISAVASSQNGVTKTPPATSATSSQAPPSPAAKTPSPAAPAAPQYTPEQQQAIEAAKGYLQLGSGFSRLGLIQQLDSSAGSSFPRSVARFAVNHINVNWDQQAVEAAKGYMQEGGFSYGGMVQQLESPDGNDFTYSQAVYAAKAVGL
jgi:hypothetical protein